MTALRLLGIGNVAAGVASGLSGVVQFGRLCRTCRLLSLFFILIMPSLFLADTSDAAWGTTTVDNASYADTGKYSSIAVGTSGAVYISYQGRGGANRYLMYATNVSGSWGTTTVDSSGNTGAYSSIAVGTSGAVYISYQNSAGDNSLKYATNVTGSWVTTTLDSTAYGGYYTSIAVGTSGAAYISYYVSTDTNDLRYATNVTGAWGTTTVDSSGADVGDYTSIAVGTSGAAYISYHTSSDASSKNTVKYATNVTGSWVKTTLVSNTTGGGLIPQ